MNTVTIEFYPQVLNDALARARTLRTNLADDATGDPWFVGRVEELDVVLSAVTEDYIAGRLDAAAAADQLTKYLGEIEYRLEVSRALERLRTGCPVDPSTVVISPLAVTSTGTVSSDRNSAVVSRYDTSVGEDVDPWEVAQHAELNATLVPTGDEQ